MATGGSSERTGFSYEARVGFAWVGRHENLCLTLKNGDARVGERVALPSPNDREFHRVPTLLVTQVKTVRSETCAAEERYPEPEDVFYDLSLVSGSVAVNGGVFVAVVDPPPVMLVGPTGVTGDLDGDGTPEVFYYCSSNEGLHYSVWSGERSHGNRRWHYYHYVGMDIESDCDELDYAGLPD